MTEWVECGVIDDDFDYTTHQVVDVFGQRGPTFKLNNIYRLSKDNGLASRQDQIKRCVELQQSQQQADYHSQFYYQPIQIIQVIPARGNHEQPIN